MSWPSTWDTETIKCDCSELFEYSHYSGFYESEVRHSCGFYCKKMIRLHGTGHIIKTISIPCVCIECGQNENDCWCDLFPEPVEFLEKEELF